MFHTFEADSVRGRSRDGQTSQTARRAATARACEQCRRRKIRCDGEQPCEACQWYKKADLCHYSNPRPSRRHVEKLSATVDEYRTVLVRLFPSTAPESLLELSREKLLELLAAEGRPEQSTSPTASPAPEHHVSPLSPEDDNLESLHTMPEESGDSQESSSPDIVATVSDDVNALSLSVKQPSSYLGISSIVAIQRVILWLDPGSINYFSRTPPKQARQSIDNSYPPAEANSWDPQQQTPSPQAVQPHLQPNGLQMINAYFAYFHAFVPLLDEANFREVYMSGRRTDSRWLALVNTVFALGSIAAYDANDGSHELYYRRARQYLSLDSLASSHLETIQTLGLLGGYYLHYVSQPNLAVTLMGATLRMATTLGMHREFAETHARASRRKHSGSVDLRRRVWWSLFCMDTWGCMTLGRPSMGRWSHAISAKLPHYSGERESTLSVLPLVENIRFCKIATQIQDHLAVAPTLNYPEMANLDHQLVEWYNNLPALLKTHEPCPENIATTRTVVRWRYQSQRILLHRPALLNYAMRRIPFVALRNEERQAVNKCRMVADETIRDISSATRLNQMCGWNAVWFIFQAVMIPLLGLFIGDDTVVEPVATIDSCRTQVEIAMIALVRMESWSPTARRTLEVVSRIFDASKRGPESSDAGSTVHSGKGGTVTPGAAPPPPYSFYTHTDLPVAGMGGNEQILHNLSPSMDDPNSQNFWDYITWSDSYMWRGFSDVSFRHDGIPNLSSLDGSDDQKSHVGEAAMYDNPFLNSNSIPFQ